MTIFRTDVLALTMIVEDALDRVYLEKAHDKAREALQALIHEDNSWQAAYYQALQAASYLIRFRPDRKLARDLVTLADRWTTHAPHETRGTARQALKQYADGADADAASTALQALRMLDESVQARS